MRFRTSIAAWLSWLAILGVALAQQPENALPELLRKHQANPTDAQVCQQIGVLYTRLQELDKAAEFFREALKINPGFLGARKNLGTVLWFLKEKKESEEQFLTVLKSLPQDPVAHLYLGLAAYERQDFPQAAQHFDGAGELASDNPEVMPMAIESYLASGQFRQASRVLEKAVAKDPANARAWLWLAEAYDKQNLPDKAYQAHAKAIETEPDSEECYLALSNFALAHGNPDFARSTVARGLQRKPGSPKLLLERGIILALQGDQEQAARSFRESSETDPRWNLPLLALGIAQLQQGLFSEAAASLQRAAKAAPDDYRAHYLYATALLRGGAQGDATRRAEVVTALNMAIALNPKDAKSRASLGQVYLEQGKVDAAVKELEKASELDPQDPTAHYQLAIAYRKQGRHEAAQRRLEVFRQLKAKSRERDSELVQILKTVQVK